MNTVQVTLGTLIDRALTELEAPSERGLRVILDSNDLSTTSDTTFTLTDADAVNVSDLLEFDDELVLVTAKTDDPVPVFTCARGYYGTTKGTHAAGDVGVVNPAYPRHRVAEGVKRSFSRLESLGIPYVKATSVFPSGQFYWVEVPSEARRVLRVWYENTRYGIIREVGSWDHVRDLPTSVYPTGQILKLPRHSGDIDELHITYQAPYRWSTFPNEPVEASTIRIMEGATDLPAMYAAAWVVSAREISRYELDRTEEWNREATTRTGSSGATVRALWQNFYRSLDEARRLEDVPQHRPYRRMPVGMPRP